jgi:predicted MFS family arabinose efflux permease
VLFSYVAGVIADESDKRKLLIVLQVVLFLIVLVLSLLTLVHLLTMTTLLLFTFLIGIASAYTNPVWQAVIPDVVSKERLKEAIALNGVSFNLSRAVGPALGGLMLVAWGISSIFLFNAFSFLFLWFVLYRWHSVSTTPKHPHFSQTAKAGFEAVKKSIPFKRLLIRSLCFTIFVSVFFALLPMLSKYQWKQTSAGYTSLWVCFGTGAVAGSYFYGIWNKILNSSQIFLWSSIVIAACFILLTLTPALILLNTIAFVAGIGWINATSPLNVIAQQYSPPAFRARFLAVNVTVFQGGIALGSIFWGFLSNQIGSLLVMQIAASGMVISSLLIYFFIPVKEQENMLQDSVACGDPLLQYRVQK